MGIKETVEEVVYKLQSKYYSVIGFLECVKYTIEHVNFLWRTSSIRIWDSCYLMSLIEYRLKKLKECMDEELAEILVDGNDAYHAEVLGDRLSKVQSITECLECFENYNDPYRNLEEPKFVKEVYGEDTIAFILDNPKQTDKQKKQYASYLKKADEIERDNFKNIFKNMAENIEGWYV